MKVNMTAERRKSINQEVRECIDKSLKNSKAFLQKNFMHLEICEYKYTPDEAIDELGLDVELVNQLLEDYVIQILKTKAQFLKDIEELKKSKEKSKYLDYKPLRELAHKNLGVAKNLRIKDGIKVLEELMKKTDLDYLTLCVEALESCAIKLKPKCSYETLKLINIKNYL